MWGDSISESSRFNYWPGKSERFRARWERERETRGPEVIRGQPVWMWSSRYCLVMKAVTGLVKSRLKDDQINLTPPLVGSNYSE